MNNKKIGTQFEQEFCKYLAEHGWWAHFLTPSAGGSQPFDVIAARGRDVYAIDCKTCSKDSFPFSRIEDNQHLAFQRIIWKSDFIKCGIVILYNDEMYYVPYDEIMLAMKYRKKSVPLCERYKENVRSCFE